ncbi:MAG TPA: glycosyltransferase family 4 protein [Niabella sp.]|nr:glycosyltransferase family 4 protein [Niabella sp.]
MQNQLHIISQSTPYPGDCAVSIDILNRIKAFHNKGIDIHLHYFDINDEYPIELSDYCKTVNVYKVANKNINKTKLNDQKKHFVHNDLVENINSNNFPVLFEGLSSTGVLEKINFENRKVCIRLHKDQNLGNELTQNGQQGVFGTFIKRIKNTFKERKEYPLPKNCMYACISEEDARQLKLMGISKAAFVPAFPTWQAVDIITGTGNFCLFHGNLSEPENEKAAFWLLNNVFNKIRIPFVIAGKNPTNRLIKAAHLYQHTCIVSNPCDSELNDLIHKAHINILPCLRKNYTGIRFKLLHAMYRGRHCITTPTIVRGSGLEKACHIGSSANNLAAIISQVYPLPFMEEEIKVRKKLLYETYNNEENINSFIDYLW